MMRWYEQAVNFAKFFAKPTACLVLSMTILAGCEENTSPKMPSVYEEKSDTLLTRAIYSAHLQLDPHFAKVVADAAPVRDLFVGLTAFNTKGEIVPAVGKNSFTDDGKTWLFILDDNAKWSNDESVTAEDFVASWRRLIDPRTASPFAGYLAEMGLINAKEILAQTLLPEELGIKALNKNTLQIELEQPNMDLPKWLAHSALLPTYQGKAPQNEIVSNGAYRVETLEEKRLILKAREDNTPFQNVVYQLISTVQNPARFDLVENPLANYHVNTLNLPRLCSYFYEFNFNDPVVSQKAVRQAIRSMITPMEVGQSLGIPIHFVLPKTIWQGEERQLSTSSTEQILAKLGVKDSNPLRLTLLFEKNELHERVANRMVRSLSQSDLFRISLLAVDDQMFTQKQAQQTYHLARAEQCGYYDEPLLFLRRFHSQSPANHTGYANESVDQWLDELEALELSQELKNEHITHIVRQLNNDIAILPLFQYQRKIALDPSIVGIDANNMSEVIYSKDLSRQTKKDK